MKNQSSETSFIDQEDAVRTLMNMLAAEGPSGREGPVADAVKAELAAAGVLPASMRHTGLKRLPPGFTTGNLIVKLRGTTRAPRMMFSAHLDTVPLCRGAVPVRRGDRIVPKGKTGLGGDNRASVAALIVLARTLLRDNPARPPITLLFTVGEENGLNGAKAFQPADAGFPAMCYNLDGSGERGGVIGALGAVRWSATIHGRSTHAGVNPEGGISAALIASEAIAKLKQEGWFGRIERPGCHGTANVGTMQGGEADNQVMDRITVTGECRSHSRTALERITRTWREAFHTAAAHTRNRDGECGSVEWNADNDYPAFRLKKSEPVVQRFLHAAPRAGRAAEVEIIPAGLDANILNKKGIPTLTFDAGNHHAHDLKEYVHIPRYLQACELLLHLATVRSNETRKKENR